jgi:putative hydrolase of the HAD superfamily
MTPSVKVFALDFGGVVSRTLFKTHRRSEDMPGLAPGTLIWIGPFDPDGDLVWRSMQAGQDPERGYRHIRARETRRLVGAAWNTVPQCLRRVRGGDPEAAIGPEALAAIGAARAAGVKRAILANEHDLSYGPELRTKLPFLAWFDLIVEATCAGILNPDLNPDPRASAAVTEGLKVAPAECVLVDDQKRTIDGAEAVGVKTVPFDVGKPAERYRGALAMLKVEQPMEAET